MMIQVQPLALQVPVVLLVRVEEAGSVPVLPQPLLLGLPVPPFADPIALGAGGV